MTMNFTDAGLLPAEHGYYPLGVEIPGFEVNQTHFVTLVSTFMTGWAAILAVVYLVSARVSPSMGSVDRLTLMWFALCGCIHFFFEGYFAYNHVRMGPAQDLFGQLWKEYSLSDSRYLTSDAFVLWMESVTAFVWGPFSFALVYMITVDHPLRHAFQLVVSLGQIYGLVLYYATSLFEHYYNNVSFCRPERYYFWFYYAFFNAIWLFVPTPLMLQSIAAIGQAFKDAKAHRKPEKSVLSHSKAE